MKTIFHALDSKTPEKIWLISIFTILILCFIYSLFGHIVEIEPLFILPVIIASWYGSSRSGVFLGILITVLLVAERHFLFGVEVNSELLFYYVVPYVFSYSFVSIVITNFRDVHRVESDAADKDYLTGLLNLRGFYIELASELVRSNRYRHTFSLAYIDLDEFKYVNDNFGHNVGDRLLVVVSQCLSSNLRAVDRAARVGGDEFVCLLPETKSADAKQALSNVINALRKQMEINNWPVTFSIGLVTFEEVPDNVKEVVKVADELMYSVKNNDKNDIAYHTWHSKSKF